MSDVRCQMSDVSDRWSVVGGEGELEKTLLPVDVEGSGYGYDRFSE
jgi:hypothetical protein